MQLLYDTLLYTRNLLLITVLVMFLIKFTKSDTLWKLLTAYTIISLLKIIIPPYNNLLSLFLYLQMCVLTVFYYKLYINKIQRITAITIFSASTIGVLFFWLTIKDKGELEKFSLIYTILYIAIFSLIHHFNQLCDKNKRYNYFNISLFAYMFFNLTNIFLLFFIAMFYENKIVLKQIYDSSNLALDIILQFFLIKQWLVETKRNSSDNSIS